MLGGVANRNIKEEAMYENYSITLGESFRDIINEIFSGESSLGHDESFKMGYVMALHRVFTLMAQAADAYDIPLETLSLDSLTEEQFLL
jgi:hypothetical protein